MREERLKAEVDEIKGQYTETKMMIVIFLSSAEGSLA